MSLSNGAKGFVVGLTTAAILSQLVKEPDRSDWKRTNYAGRTVSLRGGMQAAGAAALVPILLQNKGLDRVFLAGSLATGMAGAAGILDDLDLGKHDGEKPAKGLKGHLGALRKGQVTTGVIKILGIGLGAAGAALLLTSSSKNSWGKICDIMVRAGIIAGSANLTNLFDLRPGRALKVITLGASPLVVATIPGAALAGAAVGIAANSAPEDLAEVTMLGDTGANALGALVGTAAATIPSRWNRGAILATLVLLTAASEKISFSQVISRVKILHLIDSWGRKFP